MFISRDSTKILEGQLKDFDMHSCDKCSEINSVKNVTPAVIALRIISRALALQIDAHVNNNLEHLDKSDNT